MKTLLLAGLALVSLTGCSTGPRSWTPESLAGHGVKVEGLGHVEYEMAKQRDDYVAVHFTIYNDSDAPAHFKPIDATTRAYGFSLRPDLPGATSSRNTAAKESAVVIPGGGSTTFSERFNVSPAGPDSMFSWTVAIDGLMVGDRELPTILLPMPTYVPPFDDGRTQRNGRSF